MIYILAIVMGYFIGANGYVETRTHRIGMSYANPTMGALSKLALASLLPCLLTASYLAGSADGNSFWSGLGFFLCTQVGGIAERIKPFVVARYLISVLALPVNILTVIGVYVLTRFWGDSDPRDILDNAPSFVALLGAFIGLALDPIRLVICLACGKFIKNRWAATAAALALISLLVAVLTPEKHLVMHLVVGSISTYLIVWGVHTWVNRRGHSNVSTLNGTDSTGIATPETPTCFNSTTPQTPQSAHTPDRARIASTPLALSTTNTARQWSTGEKIAITLAATLLAAIFAVIVLAKIQRNHPVAPQIGASEIKTQPLAETKHAGPAATAVPDSTPYYTLAYAGPQGSSLYLTNTAETPFHLLAPGTQISVRPSTGKRYETVIQSPTGTMSIAFVDISTVSPVAPKADTAPLPAAGRMHPTRSLPLSHISWSATITEISGQDTSEAHMQGTVTVEDAMEYCTRDPGDETDGTPLSIHRCADKVLAEEDGKIYRATADCLGGVIDTTHLGSFELDTKLEEYPWRDIKTGAPLEGGMIGGGATVSAQFQILCPRMAPPDPPTPPLETAETDTPSTSFDCSLAQRWDELAICSDSEIAALDRVMASLYREILSSKPNPAAIREDQKAWLNRRATISDRKALVELYQQRIGQLRGVH